MLLLMKGISETSNEKLSRVTSSKCNASVDNKDWKTYIFGRVEEAAFISTSFQEGLF